MQLGPSQKLENLVRLLIMLLFFVPILLAGVLIG